MQHKQEILNQMHTMCAKDEQAMRCPLQSYFNQEVDEVCRQKMVEWCFTIVDSFNLSRESVWRAMDILGRYLTSGKGLSVKVLQDKQSFQLAATVCLYMAVKVCENVEMTIGFLVKLCRDFYTSSEFINMEHDILFALNWSICQTTPLDFVRYFLLLQSDFVDLETRDRILKTAQKHLDFATSDSYFASCKQSSVGIACLGAALVESDMTPAEQEQFWTQLSSMLNFDFASRQVREVERRIMLASGSLCKPKIQSQLVLSPSICQNPRNGIKNEQTSPVSILSCT